MQPDDRLCFCFHVSLRKVRNFIRVHRPRVASQISECGGAGTGCGWCIPFLRRCFEAAQNERATDELDIRMSMDEYARGRSEYVRNENRSLPDGATPVDDQD